MCLIAAARAQSAANLEASGLAASPEATHLSANLSVTREANSLAAGAVQDSRSQRAPRAALLPELGSPAAKRPRTQMISPAALTFGGPAGSGQPALGGKPPTVSSGSAYSPSSHAMPTLSRPKPGVQKPSYPRATPRQVPSTLQPQP
jgi:hypothetical protein